VTAVASRTSRENPEWVRDKGDSVRTQLVQVRNIFRAVQLRLTLLASDESGMSTVEYAIGTIAAAAFGAILYTVVTGDSIVSALTRVIGRALNTKV
jgi:hypothetical protein